ncbi:MAG: restriction endonuclease [Parvularculaceae bacterium]|nr:restriction endonuclease [Parvularculaceae bacterium]
MSVESLVPSDIKSRYDVYEWRNGLAVLHTAHAECFRDILTVLREFSFARSDVLTPGGSKSGIARKIDSRFYELGWQEKTYQTAVIVDDQRLDSPTHSVDCVKGKVALELEWNNKDPFFDRDLNNFRQLFDLRAIEVGVIVTRATELQKIFVELGRGSSFGNSTTHVAKLLPRLEGGAGGGCPIVVFGITENCYVG